MANQEPTPLTSALQNGRSVNMIYIRCEHCGNEFYVPGLSREFLPNCCCYCGAELRTITMKDGEA